MPAAVPILCVDSAIANPSNSGPHAQLSFHEALFPSTEEVYLASAANIFMPKIGAASHSRDRDSGIGLMDEDYVPLECVCFSSNDKPELKIGDEKFMELDNVFDSRCNATSPGIDGCCLSLSNCLVSPAKKPAKMGCPTTTTCPEFPKHYQHVESATYGERESMRKHSLCAYNNVTFSGRDSNKLSNSLQVIPPGCGTASEGIEHVAMVGESATSGSAWKFLASFANKCSHVREPSGSGTVDGDTESGARGYTCSVPNAAHTPALRFAWEFGVFVHVHLTVGATRGTAGEVGRAAVPLVNPLAYVNPALTARLAHLIGRRMGDEHVDVLGELAARDLRHVIQKVLLYLPVHDVARVLLVSKEWQEIVTCERKTLRKHWRIRRAANKQTPVIGCFRDNGSKNLPTPRVLKRQNHATRGNGSVGPGSRETKGSAASREPADRASRFLKAARELCQDEELRVCHRCSWPARCTRSYTRALCTNGSCAYDFCTRCLCAYRGMCSCCAKPSNGGTASRVGSGLPGSGLPGSRRSRRNLHRL